MAPWSRLALWALVSLSLVQFLHAAVYQGMMYIETCPGFPPQNKRELGSFLQEIRSRRLQGNQGERDIPDWVEGLCTNSTQITGDASGGLIAVESVEFEFNSRLPDSVFGDGRDIAQPAAVKKRNVQFPSTGNGKGYLENMLGTIGFGALTITKRPDSSSAELMQLAADNEGVYDVVGSCPRSLFVVIEIPLKRLGVEDSEGTDSLFISIIPAIINEWHISLPESDGDDDVRERISFRYGGMTYAYGIGNDTYGLDTAGLAEASCNLDVFCNIYPCVCAWSSLQPDKREERALTNWFDVLACNDGVNIFDPDYKPPSLADAFINNTIDGVETLQENYLNDLWK